MGLLTIPQVLVRDYGSDWNGPPGGPSGYRFNLKLELILVRNSQQLLSHELQ